MHFNGRDLKFGRLGEGVRSLHDNLPLLGYPIPLPELDDAFFGEATRAAVVDFRIRNRFCDHAVVDACTAQAITNSADRVRPRVVHREISNGKAPLPTGLIISVMDRDLRSETELGRTFVATDGGFEVRYTAEHFRRVEKAGAYLIVRALAGPDGRVIAEERVLNSGMVEQVKLVLLGWDDGPSELDRYLPDIDPLLDGAIGQRVVPGWLREQLDRLTVTLRHRRLDEVLRPAPVTESASLADLLPTMPAPLPSNHRRSDRAVTRFLRIRGRRWPLASRRAFRVEDLPMAVDA